MITIDVANGESVEDREFPVTHNRISKINTDSLSNHFFPLGVNFPPNLLCNNLPQDPSGRISLSLHAKVEFLILIPGPGKMPCWENSGAER
jgi:hypothetical protein